MGLYVNTNVSSLMAQKNLGKATSELGKSFGRLSSGYRINKASDDAAGISVSENARKQIRGTEQGLRNAKDGLSMASIMDTGLGAFVESFQRMRELAIQASNGSYSDAERGYMNNEYQDLIEHVRQIASTIEFNGVKMMDGSAGTLNFQVGFSTSQAITTTAFNTNHQLIANGSLITTQANAQTAISDMDTVLNTVISQRAQVGAFMNRMQSVLNAGSNAVENMSASERQIREVNFASETANLSRYQIIQQAGTTILTQANSSTRSVADLIQ